MMDVALTLAYLVPGAIYLGSLTANDEAAYQAIAWRDERPQPTWPELVAAADAALAAYQAAQPVSAVDSLADTLRSKGVITQAEADAVKGRAGDKG